MMTNAHSQNLPVSNSASYYARLSASLVDRATARALRRTTKNAVRDTRSSASSVDLTTAPTIRTMDRSSRSSNSSVPVVIVPAAHQSATKSRSLRPSWSQVKFGLSWAAAVFVALTVPLALAIPTELLGQHG